MDTRWPPERLVQALQQMERAELINRIKHFSGPFRLDFTDQYLQSASDDRLRHILLAAMIGLRRHD